MRPEWKKEKGIALLRLGGLSPVKQKCRNIVPEKYGLWAFIFPYWDWWFVSGEMSQDKFPKKDVPNHRQPKPRKFFAKGTIYTRFWVRGSMPVWTEANYTLGPGNWYRTNDAALYEHLPKIFSEDLKQGRRLAAWGEEADRGEIVDRVKHPYSPSGYIGVDHMEVFVPKGTRIK